VCVRPRERSPCVYGSEEEPSRRRKKGRQRRGPCRRGPRSLSAVVVFYFKKYKKINSRFFRIDFCSYFGLILDFLALFLACVPDYLLSFVAGENRLLGFPLFHIHKSEGFLFPPSMLHCYYAFCVFSILAKYFELSSMFFNCL
jgi:hypothetical protein